MKPTAGIISIVIVTITLILMSLRANKVNASYEDANAKEAEIRFPFKEELAKIKKEASDEAVEISKSNTIVEVAKEASNVVESPAIVKRETTKKATPVVVEAKKSKTNTTNYTADVKKTSSASAAPFTYTKEEIANTPRTITISKSNAMDIEGEVVIEEVEILDNIEVFTIEESVDDNDFALAAEVAEAEVVIEDISIIETSILDFADDIIEEETNEASTDSETPIIDMYNASLEENENVGVKNEEFMTFMKPFQQLVQVETGNPNALLEVVKIYDVAGKKVLEVSDLDLGGSTFNLLPRGNYTIEVVSGNSFHTAILSKL